MSNPTYRRVGDSIQVTITPYTPRFKMSQDDKDSHATMFPGFDYKKEEPVKPTPVPDRAANGECWNWNHKYVDVGFHFTKLVCSVCNKEKKD